jgi:hypothetical protein
MSSFIKVKFERHLFDRAFKKYVEANKRATAGLVEHTMRKVITGFSPRSASAKKVVGMRQTLYEKRATKTKIKQEFKQRESAGKGTLRPPRHAVSPRAKGLKKSKKQAIAWRSNRGTAWLQATMLYKQWRPNEKPKSRSFTPSLDKKHSGAKPNTKVKIKTTGNKPFALWQSRVPGVVSGKHRRLAEARALKSARQDMMVYVIRKHRKLRM